MGALFTLGWRELPTSVRTCAIFATSNANPRLEDQNAVGVRQVGKMVASALAWSGEVW